MPIQQIYPSVEDPLFAEKIAHMDEFGIFKIQESEKVINKKAFEEKAKQLCQFEKTYYQHFVSQYISRRTPYRSLLLYHGLGSGKTCSAITIAEAFSTEQRLYNTPSIWIISRKALKGSFEQEIFRMVGTPDVRDQCTGDSYLQAIPNASQMPQDKLAQRLQKMIRSKYQFFGYDQFANMIDKSKEDGTFDTIVKNKVIIVDEAHNLRNIDQVGDHKKKIVEPLLEVLRKGTQNRLIFLSATPMYNEAEEMLWLLSLLLINDKREGILDPFNLPSFYSASGRPNKTLFDLCAQLSQTYVSYIKGNNPFSFAIRLPPSTRDESYVKFLADVPPLTLANKPLEASEKDWLKWIPNGLVVSPLGSMQIAALQEKRAKKLSSATQRQINICVYQKHLGKEKYVYQEGEEGLTAILRLSDELEPNQYHYQNPRQPLFDPAFGELPNFACKLDTLSRILEKSRGVVLIYSMFVWGGILPAAFMLEHMGFSRYKERDFLKMDNKVKQSVKYTDIKKPAYCILSSESEKRIMGSTHIDDLLKDINSPENKNGEKVKVILISPVAGEGLSFKNIREMHVLDPWYHLNNQEQAIGRAIRNCSHSSLPLEERNVTVFLHTTVYPDNKKETSDLHAYRLASIKYQHIQKVDKIIKENALDCHLMKHINHYPTNLFPFKVILHTSRGQQLPYQYGDTDEEQIQCKTTRYRLQDTRSLREENYAAFVPTLQQKLRKQLERNYKDPQLQLVSYSYDELLTLIHPDKAISTSVLEETLFPYRLWDNKVLIYHYDKFIISAFDKNIPYTNRLQLQEKTKEEVRPVETCAIKQIFEQLDKEDPLIATLKIFQSLDSHCWNKFAEEMVQTATTKLSPKLLNALSLLEAQGAFITQREVKTNMPSKYSGYVDLFAEEDKWVAYLWDESEEDYRETTKTENARIIANRKHHPFTNPSKTRITDTIGFVQRYKNSKEPNSPYRFQFKLGFNNEAGKRSGVVCETLKKPQIQEELSKLVGATIIPKANVSQLCFNVMLELLKKGRMWFPVMYKK